MQPHLVDEYAETQVLLPDTAPSSGDGRTGDAWALYEEYARLEDEGAASERPTPRR
jgi:hypothetical protein